MENERIKVVLIGCGAISAAWLVPTLKEKKIKIIGLVDVNKNNAEAKAHQFKLHNVFISSNFDEALKLKPDAVFNCTPPEIHYETTIEALKNGCHVLVEKPLAHSLYHAKKMVEEAEKRNKILSVIQNRRYYHYIRGVQKFLSLKKLGNLTTVNSEFYIGAHFGGFRDEMKHVLLLDMAIHTFDMARFLTCADPISVYCHEWNPLNSWYKYDASANAIFEMTGGIIYTYLGSWCAEGVNTSWAGNWRFIAEKGSAIWDGMDKFFAQIVTGKKGFIRKTKDIKISFPDKKEENEGHHGLIRDFICAIKTGKKPMTAAQDNIKSLAMVFGAIESAKKKKRVEITI
ncbi:MAG TPA: Gfo/Idh/MocA family oxidoreductase [bacterium]|nr:Gfo/Idh/MocA family oxidoreductase [bacterium]HPP08132.1 Gfo/Idh/MocA family oxidoreductase [bacterium]